MNALLKVYRLIFSKFFIILIISALSINAVSETYQLGDLAPRGTPDGQLTAADSLILQRMILGEILPTEDEVIIGDVAPFGVGDGVLNAGDLVVQQRAILGHINLSTIDISPLQPPVLNAGASPANINPYEITGTATPDTLVDIYVEGVKQKQVLSNAIDGTFSIELYLYDGINAIYATETDGVDISQNSNTVQINYINEIDRNNLPASITENTVWTPGVTPQPYIITSSLTIAPDVSLIIQPGTEVKFESYKGLIVNGNLKVSGAELDHVLFTPNQLLSTEYVWTMIDVVDGGVVDINYADIQDAHRALYFHPGSNGSVNNSRIYNNKYGIISEGNSVDKNKNPAPVINFNSIYNNLISYRAFNYADNKNVALDANNNWWGTLDGYSIATKIDDYNYLLTTQSQPHIDFSAILDAESGEIFSHRMLHGLLLQPNVMLKGLYTLAGTLAVEAGQTLTIDAGTLVESGLNSGIHVAGILNVTGTSLEPAVFTTNKVLKNDNDWSGIGVADGGVVNINYADIQYAGTAITFQPGSSGSVRNSLLTNNSTGIHTEGADFGASAEKNPMPIVTNNSIYNNQLSNYYTRWYGGNDTVTLIAENNWWGSLDVSYIFSTINDIEDNPEHSPTVDISPILASENGVAYEFEILRGRLTQTNTSLSGNYVLAGSLLVDAGQTLTIEAGSLIESDGLGSINVKGTLNIVGVPGNYVNLISNATSQSSGDYWSGIIVEDGGVVNISYADIQYADMAINFQPGSSGSVSNSRLINNNNGLYVIGNITDVEKNPVPVVVNNSIYNNFNWNYFASGFANNLNVVLNATDNWWGTVDAGLISTRNRGYIYDSVSSPTIDISTILDAEYGVTSESEVLNGRLKNNSSALSGAYNLGVLIVDEGQTLTIDAGTVIKGGKNSRIDVRGTLIVSGTSLNPVVFDTSQTLPEILYWQGINVVAGGSVIIDYADIQHANIAIEFNPGSSGNVTNSILINNNFGIYTSGDNANSENNPLPIINSSSIYNNLIYNYRAWNYANNENVVLNATYNWWGSVDANVIYGPKGIYEYQDNPSTSPIVNVGTILDAEDGNPYSYTILHGILPQSNMILNGNYSMVGSITVGTEQTLTVEAGSRIESDSGESIKINGTFNVVGSAQNRAVFTSGREPQTPFDWAGIIVNDGGIVNIDYAEIQYATNGVTFNPGSAGDVTNSLLLNNVSGVRAVGSTTNSLKNPKPNITNNDIYDNSTNYVSINYADNENAVLNAINNWWGVAGTTAIGSTIYDINDNPSTSPVIDVSSYLLNSIDEFGAGNYELQTCPIVSIINDIDFLDIYPANDIEWIGSGFSDIVEIEKAFNYARSLDNSVIQYLKLPDQVVWDAMPVLEKGLYLINSERQARGIKPYEGVSPNVNTVAQNYADHIRVNNQLVGHSNDGKDPLQRLEDDYVIRDNSDILTKLESIYFAIDSVNIPSASESIVDAVYSWIYKDFSDGNLWGHRDHILQTGLFENSSATNSEGLLGIGISIGNYDPEITPPVNFGAVIVLNTIDPSSTWDHSVTQMVNIDAAQACNSHVVLNIDETSIPVAQIKKLIIEPSDIILVPGASAQIKVIATYLDDTQHDITSASSFIADNVSVVNIAAGTVTALRKGFVYVTASANGIISNNILVTVDEATDLANLNGTFAEDYLDLIPGNVSIAQFDPKAFALLTGKVTDKFGVSLSDVTVSIHREPRYGSVRTDIEGKFVFAAEAGIRKLVYKKPGYLTLHRDIVSASQAWTVADDVIMLAVDNKQTAIDLNLSTSQTHQSTVVNDAFGSRSTTLVFNDITSATVLSTDGTQRTLSDFFVRATEYELPQSMPAALPKESAFTYCADLQIPGVRDDEVVTFDNDVVMYVDNFLNFDVGEVVPIGYYDRNIGEWVASENGVVVKLLDTDNDGYVDGLDISGDNIADDINLNNDTSDEVSGLENYTPEKTYWRGSFNHFTPYDLNWPFVPPNSAEARGDFKTETSIENKDQKELECTGSYVKPETQSFHEDISIAGTDLTLHYSSQRTQGYKHKFNVKVSEGTISPDLLEMIARLEIGGQVFEETFLPETNKEAEFIWDGNDPTGNRLNGAISGRLRIGYKYDAAYASAGTATSGQDLAQIPTVWATLSASSVNLGIARDKFYFWNDDVVSVQNTYANQIANGWSISNNHMSSPIGNIYKGDGEVENTDKSSLVLRTGITSSRYPKDDGDYKKGGSDLDYLISPLGTLIDKVTGLEWQYNTSPKRFTTKLMAEEYCSTASFVPNYAPETAKNGWRLPTNKEIVYTIDKSSDSRFIPVHKFQALQYWHSNRINLYPDNQEFPVYCVKGTIILDELYVSGLIRDDASEVVIDQSNGLMWQDDISVETITKKWTEAIDYCELSEHAGHTDWRLPNINELAYTLPNNVFIYKTTLPHEYIWTPTASFINPYWSSTPNPYRDGKSWAMESDGFSSYLFSNNDRYYVRCVRDNIQSARSPYRFDERGKHIKTIDLDTGNNLMSFTYYEDGLLEAMTDRFGDTITINRNHVTDEISSITTQDGYVTTLTIDDNNDLTRVDYPDNSNFQFDYFGTTSLLTRKTDPNGNIYNHQFDPDDGRTIRTDDLEGGEWNFFSTRPGDGTTLYGYNTAESNTYQTLRTILENGDTNKVTTLFDSTELTDLTQSDDLKQTLQSCGVTTVIDKVIDSKTKEPIPSVISIKQPSTLESITQLITTYGVPGNEADTTKKTVSIDLNGKNSTVFTDAKTGVTVTTSAENRTTTLNYDPVTMLLQSRQTPDLFDTTYTYDSRGRQKSIITGTRETTFTYDPISKGDVTYITADDGKVTEFEYDALGHVKTIIYPDTHRVENTYDNNGNLKTKIVPRPATHEFTYTATDNVKTQTRPKEGAATEVTQYDYDKEGNLRQITLPSTKVITNFYTNGQIDYTDTPEGIIDYSYACNSKIGRITEGAETITYGYDGSLLKDITYTGELSKTISQTYNTDFNINSLSYAGQTTSIGYDDDGLLTSTNGYTITREPLNGLPKVLSDAKLLQNRGFNGYGEANSVTTKVNNLRAYDYTLIYNDLGKISNKTETLDTGAVNNYTYTYDDRRRLDTVTKNGTLIEDYGYDANGNRILQTNTARGITAQSSTYNLGDQLQSAGTTTYEYDADGYLKKKTETAGVTTYSYSSQGRLLEVVTPSKTITYKHNAIGNRVAKLVNGIVTEKYLWLDKTTLLATYDATDTLKQRYQYTDSNTPTSFTQSGLTYYIVTDHLGSPRVITNSAGGVVKKLEYDSFGNVIGDSNPGFVIPFGFAGGLFDVDTGLVRFGFRDYDADVGRWTATGSDWVWGWGYESVWLYFK